VGIELLGAAFADERLVALGHAWESAAQLRRVPPSTPPLAGRPIASANILINTINEIPEDRP